MKTVSEQIEVFYKGFGIDIKVVSTAVGPTVSSYFVDIMSSTPYAKFRNMEQDLSVSLKCNVSISLTKMGITVEVPNSKKSIVEFDKNFLSEGYDLPLFMGLDSLGETVSFDLTKSPHMIVAGATGQGKSVALNCMISSLISKKNPEDLKLLLIDPKRVEFSQFSQCESYLYENIITEPEEAFKSLERVCNEMDNRYFALQSAKVRNIREYNQIVERLDSSLGHSKMPYIVIVIDEWADLILRNKEVEKLVCRLAQLSRAVGIHVILATQRPSADIITGSIKANFPTRIAFKTSSSIDSKVILNFTGAEKLLGNGDMIINNGTENLRVQGAYISNEEINQIIEESNKLCMNTNH